MKDSYKWILLAVVAVISFFVFSSVAYGLDQFMRQHSDTLNLFVLSACCPILIASICLAGIFFLITFGAIAQYVELLEIDYPSKR